MSAKAEREAREILRHTSNLCLRKLHDQCVAEICECDCHHRIKPPVGGTPKDKPLDFERSDRRPKEPSASEPAPIRPVEPPVAETPPQRPALNCPECGSTHYSAQGLKIHRGQKHKTVHPAKAQPKAATRLTVADDRHVLVVTSEQPEAIVLSTKADADRVADLLDVLGVRSQVLPLEA